MRSKVSKWVIPGILTVLLGTAAIVQFTKAGIEEDLTSRAELALRGADLGWARVHFDGRDAKLTGISTNKGQPAEAEKLVAELHGVRSVTRAVDMAPLASPYPFLATKDGGSVALSGGVPDEAARKSLLEKANADKVDLKLLSGVDNRAQWLAATDFALRQLQMLDPGEVSLRDLTLSMSGRAESRDAYETISLVLNAGFPDGVQRGEIDIVPPLQIPFEWQAEFDGERISMRGYVPDTDTIEQIGKSMPSGARMTPDILLASGAPEGFAENAAALVGTFAHVSGGAASIVDTEIKFSGEPISPEAAAKIQAQLNPIGAALDLAPPLVTDYIFSAEKTPSGLIYAGYVPDEELKNGLGTNGDVEALQLGRGAPDSFAEAIELGNAALAELENGIFTIKNNKLEIGGLVNDAEAYDAAQTVLESGLLGRFELDVSGIEAPVLTPPLPALDILMSPPSLPVEAEATPIEAAATILPELPNLNALREAPSVPTLMEEPVPEEAPADTEDSPAKVAALPVAPEPAPTEPSLPPLDLCRTHVATFEAENSILFNAGSARLAETSIDPLDRLAAFLKECPKVEIYVEGHTDSDGPDRTNMALSVARAEAVIVELIGRGIDSRRLYAVGYGESSPVADNDTRAGKAQNRRIAFEILETAE